MKLPKKLDILGMDYNVVKDTKHASNWGHAKPEEAEIHIYLSDTGKNQPEAREAETLLHEIIHCVDGAVRTNLDEEATCRLSRGLFTVMRNNNLDFRKPQREVLSSKKTGQISRAKAREAVKKVKSEKV